MSRSVRSAFLLLALVSAQIVGASAPAAAGFPTERFFPGCGDTSDNPLQHCVDISDPGDSIQINSNDHLPAVAIDRSLTIFPGAGFHPVIVGFLAGGDGSSHGTMDITIRDLTLSAGIIGTFTGGSGHTLTIKRVTIQPEGGSDTTFVLGAAVPSTFNVTNTVVHAAGEESAVHIAAEQPSGLATFSFVGNRVSLDGEQNSESGLRLDIEGTGTTRVRIINNTFWRVASGGTGNVAGIEMNVDNSGHADLDVVGNTLERVGASGLSLRNDVQGSGRVTLDVFNNIISHTRLSAIELDSQIPSTLAFRAGYNDYFSNGSRSFLEGHSAGPGNLKSPPTFVKASQDDLRLDASSPLIDKGIVCSPGGVANLDAARHGRLAGSTVDIGAFERGAGKPTGEAFVGGSGNDSLRGTNGADILCGLGGRDDIRAGGGADYVDGGSGGDLIFGDGGPDRLFGGAGDDDLCSRDGVHGNDHIVGGAGSDGFRADPGDSRSQVEHAGLCPFN